MSNVGYYRQVHRPVIQRLGRGRPADAATVLQTGVLRDFPFTAGRASGEELPDTVGKLVHKLAVGIVAPQCLTLPAALTDLLVGQALLLSELESCGLHQ